MWAWTWREGDMIHLPGPPRAFFCLIPYPTIISGFWGAWDWLRESLVLPSWEYTVMDQFTKSICMKLHLFLWLSPQFRLDACRWFGDSGWGQMAKKSDLPRNGWWGTHLHVLVFPFRTSKLGQDCRKSWETSSSPLIPAHSPSNLSGRADRICADPSTSYHLHHRLARALPDISHLLWCHRFLSGSLLSLLRPAVCPSHVF